jgi:hypothetical protein
MKADPTSTFPGAFLNDANAQRFRNQATGVSPCLSESEAQGARRSKQVIDCAPPAQLRVKDRSYPQPSPVVDPLTGKLYDRATGKPYKAEGAGVYGASTPGLWAR